MTGAARVLVMEETAKDEDVILLIICSYCEPLAYACTRASVPRTPL